MDQRVHEPFAKKTKVYNESEAMVEVLRSEPFLTTYHRLILSAPCSCKSVLCLSGYTSYVDLQLFTTLGAMLWWTRINTGLSDLDYLSWFGHFWIT